MTAAPSTHPVIVHGPRAYPHNADLRLEIPDSDEGIELTVAAAMALAHDAALESPALSRFVRRLAPHQPAPSPRQLYDALSAPPRGLFRFEPDPDGVEHIRHPDQIIDQIERRGVAVGDCDDRAVLGAACLMRMGYKAALIVAGRTPKGRFEHIFFGYYANHNIPGNPPQIVPMDPQEGPEFGVWHPDAKRLKVYPL